MDLAPDVALGLDVTPPAEKGFSPKTLGTSKKQKKI